MHDSLLLSWRRVSVFKCYWAVEGEELRHALVKAYNTWSFGLMLKVNWPEMSFSAPLWYFEGSWWKDTLPLTLLMPWEVAQFAWHFYFKGFFLLSPKCSCNELFFRWKKKKLHVSFPTIDLAEFNPIVAEPSEATRPVGREITFFEELACCPALLESDTPEEVPTQGKEGSCRCFMKRMKKCSSYRSRTFTSPRGTYCASERSWNINILMERLIFLQTVHAWWVHSLRSL